jgi:hypothetical protein
VTKQYATLQLFCSILRSPVKLLHRKKFLDYYLKACIGCEEYFWILGITEEKAKQLSTMVVFCPACRKRAEEDAKEDQ